MTRQNTQRVFAPLVSRRPGLPAPLSSFLLSGSSAESQSSQGFWGGDGGREEGSLRHCDGIKSGEDLVEKQRVQLVLRVTVEEVHIMVAS